MVRRHDAIRALGSSDRTWFTWTWECLFIFHLGIFLGSYVVVKKTNLVWLYTTNCVRNNRRSQEDSKIPRFQRKSVIVIIYFQSFTRRQFRWHRMSDQYVAALQSVVLRAADSAGCTDAHGHVNHSGAKPRISGKNTRPYEKDDPSMSYAYPPTRIP